MHLQPAEIQSTSAAEFCEQAQLFLNQTHLRPSTWMTNVHFNRFCRKLSLQLPFIPAGSNAYNANNRNSGSRNHCS